MDTATSARDRWPRRALLLLAVVNAVTASAGAWGLLSGALSLGDTVQDRLPWGSPVVAGVALALLVALPNCVLAVAALRRRRGVGLLGIAVGSAMVVWIVVELAFIRELSFFHPLYLAVGVVMIGIGARVVRLDLGVTARSLLGEVRDVVADLPRFLAAPLVRRHHLRWGATDEEVSARLPGDDWIREPDYASTRAITIAAPPEHVWPWLAQVGHGRAGFYSDDLLDNGAVPSSHRIEPDLQRLEIGQWVPMSGNVTPHTAFRVAVVRPPFELVWRKPDSTWAWTLTRTDGGGTRVVTRIRARHDRRRWGAWVSSVVLLELGDYAMQRRMLIHLRERAEKGLAVQRISGGRP